MGLPKLRGWTGTSFLLEIMPIVTSNYTWDLNGFYVLLHIYYHLLFVSTSSFVVFSAC